jgi:hypothetical protein
MFNITLRSPSFLLSKWFLNSTCVEIDVTVQKLIQYNWLVNYTSISLDGGKMQRRWKKEELNRRRDLWGVFYQVLVKARYVSGENFSRGRFF